LVDLPTGRFAVRDDIVIGPDAADGERGNGVRKVGFAHDLVGSFPADPEHVGDFGVGHDGWRRTHGCTLRRYLGAKVSTR